jgi:hypothetical protein
MEATTAITLLSTCAQSRVALAHYNVGHGWVGFGGGGLKNENTKPNSSSLLSKFHSTTPVASEEHVILWSFIVLTWMRDVVGLV